MGSNSSVNPLPEESISELSERFSGQLVRPGEESYDEARSIWNGMFDRHPCLIAQCVDTRDVVSVVNLARERERELAVRGGGHSVAGHSTVDDGIVLDLSALNRVTVDPESRRVSVGGGATWADVDPATQEHGLVVPGGVVSDTGVAGLTLGGGYGHLTRKYGLSCDNLEAVDIVTADGSVLTASEEQNQDLFWALRGGGGNFGVVTTFHFECHPLGPEVMWQATLYPLEEAESLLKQWRSFTRGSPEEIMSHAIMTSVPELPPFPEHLHGRPVLIVNTVYAGDVEEGKKIMDPLRELTEPLLDMSQPIPYVQLQQNFDPMFPEGKRYYWKSIFLNELTDEVVQTIAEHALDRPVPDIFMPLRHLGGAVARVNEDSTAFTGRDQPYLQSIDSAWSDPDRDEEVIEWTRSFWDSLNRLTEGGIYGNFLGDEEQSDEVLEEVYGRNHQRLRRIKQKYDPENLFHRNQNIQPQGQDGSG